MTTREQYLDNDHPSTHADYYGQYVDDNTKRILIERVGIERLLSSTDPHLNDIPLARWDRLPALRWNLKSRGDYLTLAGKVCIYKEAARQLITERGCACHRGSTCTISHDPADCWCTQCSDVESAA